MREGNLVYNDWTELPGEDCDKIVQSGELSQIFYPPRWNRAIVSFFER
jgi:hypothetical protein